uniref:NIF3-like protein 1 n=1 Tax=Panstrongylus megistus TaxID=65343 RepID=A0A069DRD8_9HEMI
MSGEQMAINSATGFKLSAVVEVLEQFADPRLAAKWDNVGLLIEPATSTLVKNIMLTNDLTERVLEEAVEKKINLIISYHPPIFVSLKRITQQSWKERIVAKCLENRIAVYSPHTSWDAVYGGVTDWLGDAFNSYLCDEFEKVPLIPNTDEELDQRTGMGRLVYVNDISLIKCVELIKQHTGLTNVRIAFGNNKNKDTTVGCIALVPGSGGSLLKEVKADLYVTGEMFHHDILEANHNGVSVILTNHSDSERGFLKKMCLNLEEMLNGAANIFVSECDKDPITTI